MRAPMREFLRRKPAAQLLFFREPEFSALDDKHKIEFLKELLLKEKLSSKVTASAIRRLRELNYRDKFFFKRFLYHKDRFIASAAKKAFSPDEEDRNCDFLKNMGWVKDGRRERKLELVKSMVLARNLPAENLLQCFAAEDNLKVREMIVTDLAGRAELDERQLLAQFRHSVWFIRSAIIEVLARRKSDAIFESIEALLADPNVDVRLQLVEALKTLERDRVRVFLQKLAQDPHMRVRREAEAALRQI